MNEILSMPRRSSRGNARDQEVIQNVNNNLYTALLLMRKINFGFISFILFAFHSKYFLFEIIPLLSACYLIRKISFFKSFPLKWISYDVNTRVMVCKFMFFLSFALLQMFLLSFIYISCNSSSVAVLPDNSVLPDLPAKAKGRVNLAGCWFLVVISFTFLIML